MIENILNCSRGKKVLTSKFPDQSDCSGRINGNKLKDYTFLGQDTGLLGFSPVPQFENAINVVPTRHVMNLTSAYFVI